MTRKHLPAENEDVNKRTRTTGADPKVLSKLANAQGYLAKLQAKLARNDEEIDNDKRK